MPAARAAASRLIPSKALASANRRLLTRPSRSRRASARSSAGVRLVAIGTATMARLPTHYPCPGSWQVAAAGHDFLWPVLAHLRPLHDRQVSDSMPEMALGWGDGAA